MSEIEFEWDPAKDTSNQQKHGISFDEAKSVFSDDFARLIADPEHSEEEERFILLGTSIESNLLIVCHCIRNGETVLFYRLGKPIEKNDELMSTFAMRDNYDFSKSVKNPYIKKLKKQVTIRLDQDTISYFKELADDKGLPYQSLINLYLRDCAQSHRDLKWQ